MGSIGNLLSRGLTLAKTFGKPLAQNLMKRGFQSVFKGGIGNTLKSVARSSLDSAVDKTFNAVFDKGRNFARKTLERKMPQLVGPMEEAGQVLKDRMQDGYRKILHGSEAGGSGGGVHGMIDRGANRLDHAATRIGLQ